MSSPSSEKEEAPYASHAAYADKAAYSNEKSAASPTIEAELNDIVHDIGKGEINELAVVAEGEEKTSWFIWMLVCSSAISGLLFGYDTGVISGALVTIGSDLGPERLNDTQKTFISSATTLGALLGGLCAGILSDWIGRKPVVGIADVIFIAGAVGQAVSHDVWSMIGGRFVIGVGVGLASSIAPLYIQELSPTRQRGRMVVLNVAILTLGQVIAYGIDAGFANVSGGWRWMVGLGAVPAGIQLFLLYFLPESPRILIRRNNLKATYDVMAKIYPYAKPHEVDLKVKVLQAAVQHSLDISNSTTFFQRVRSMLLVASNRRALIIACGMQAFQQLSGFNTLMYFSATLFAQMGFDQPTAVGLIVSGTNFIFTLVALKYIDIVGRRRIMLISAPGMVFGLTLASIAFHYLTQRTGGNFEDGATYPRSWSAVVLFSMIFYVASYATGIGNVPWQQGELFGLEVRGIGTSIATATNWGANLLIGSTYLLLMARITPSGAFGFYAGLCFLGLVFVVFCFPETAGLSLEEVQMVFRRSFGIRESDRLRRIKRELKAGGGAGNARGHEGEQQGQESETKVGTQHASQGETGDKEQEKEAVDVKGV